MGWKWGAEGVAREAGDKQGRGGRRAEERMLGPEGGDTARQPCLHMIKHAVPMAMRNLELCQRDRHV